MRKFAAHYLLTPDGALLKNGIAVVQNNGSVDFTDTRGELKEMEQLIFHSGMLLCAFEFINNTEGASHAESDQPLPFNQDSKQSNYLSFQEIINLAKKLQLQYQTMTVPQIIHLTEQLLTEKGFVKKTIPGLYLLKGLDLLLLHFTQQTHLKKIV